MPEERPAIPSGHGRLAFSVMDALGEPASVLITMVPAGGAAPQYLGYATGDGYRDLPPGTHRIVLHYAQQQPFDITLATGGTTPIVNRALGRLEVPTPNALGGSVSVWVTVDDANGVRCASGYSGGRFSVDLTPGEYTVHIRYEQPQSFGVRVAHGALSVVTCHALGRVTIRTPDALGADAVVWVAVTDSLGASVNGAYSNGSVTWDLLPGRYRATARYQQHLPCDFEVVAGAEAAPSLPPLGRMAMVTPTSHEWISVRALDDQAVTGAYSAGSYQVDLLPGRYRVTHGAVWRTAEVTAGEVATPTALTLSDLQILVPTIEVSRPALGLEPYEIAPTDAGPIPLDVVLRATASDGGVVPGSLSVELRCRVRTGEETDVSLGAAGVHGAVRVQFTQGAATLRIWVVPRADGFIPVTETDGELVASDGVRFDLSAVIGDMVVTTPPIAVVSGAPASISEISLEALGRRLDTLRSPLTNDPLALGTELGIARDVQVVYPPGITDIRPEWPIVLAAIGRVLPRTGAALLMLVVRDPANNPVALSTDIQNGYWPLLNFKSGPMYGIRPFIVTHGPVQPAEEAWYRLHVATGPHHELPPGVLPVLVYPGFGWVAFQTTFVIQMMRFHDGQGAAVCKETFIVTTPAPEEWQRIEKWFLDGEVDGADTFLLEIAMSVVPFVGDGLELLRYGKKLATTGVEDPIDHVVAVLALVGLILDVAEIVTVGAATPINAAVGGVKAGFKLLKSLGNAAAATNLAEAFKALSRRIDWTSLDTVRAFADKVSGFGDLLFKLLGDIDKMKRMLTYMGLAVGVVQLEPLLEALGQLTVDEAMDLLATLAMLAEASDEEPTLAFLGAPP